MLTAETSGVVVEVEVEGGGAAEVGGAVPLGSELDAFPPLAIAQYALHTSGHQCGVE